MEEIQKFVRSISNDSSKSGASASSSFPDNAYSFNGKGLSAAVSSSSDQSGALIARPARQVVSIWTCSKLCAFFFVAGVFVGYTLKRRVRRWASKLLRRLKDD